MRKNCLFFFLILVCLSALILVSCQSTTVDYSGVYTYTTSQQMAINTYIDSNEYSIVGKITATSDFVYYYREYDTYVGDSKQYGYINDHSTFEGGGDSFIGYGVSASNLENDMDESEFVAMLNANYDLIQKLNAAGADTMFTPIYTVEVGNSPLPGIPQYRVTATAVGIKINKK